MPKTYGDLWSRIIDIDNIYRAYLAARDKKAGEAGGACL